MSCPLYNYNILYFFVMALECVGGLWHKTGEGPFHAWQSMKLYNDKSDVEEFRLSLQL